MEEKASFVAWQLCTIIELFVKIFLERLLFDFWLRQMQRMIEMEIRYYFGIL